MTHQELRAIAKMIDISTVRTDICWRSVQEMADIARRYRCIAVFTMPCYTAALTELMRGSGVLVGGVVGFPSGAETTRAKVFVAQEMLSAGCDELDMMINVAAMKSGEYQRVADDIRAVVDTAGGKPVKTILEVAYLTDDQICRASEIAVAAGARYVKTGTGWADTPTTVHHIELIRRTIGQAAGIKVAGGVRTLDMLERMVEAGASRFGIGSDSVLRIMREVDERLAAQAAPLQGMESAQR